MKPFRGVGLNLQTITPDGLGHGATNRARFGGLRGISRISLASVTDQRGYARTMCSASLAIFQPVSGPKQTESVSIGVGVASWAERKKKVNQLVVDLNRRFRKNFGVAQA